MTDPLRPVAVGPPVPPDVCPLCGAGNSCAMAGGGEPERPCWCVAVTFSAELLERVPPAARGRACVCAACAASVSLSAVATGGPA